MPFYSCFVSAIYIQSGLFVKSTFVLNLALVNTLCPKHPVSVNINSTLLCFVNISKFVALYNFEFFSSVLQSRGRESNICYKSAVFSADNLGSKQSRRWTLWVVLIRFMSLSSYFQRNKTFLKSSNSILLLQKFYRLVNGIFYFPQNAILFWWNQVGSSLVNRIVGIIGIVLPVLLSLPIRLKILQSLRGPKLICSSFGDWACWVHCPGHTLSKWS